METLHFRIHEILNDKLTDYLRTSAIKKILLIAHDKTVCFQRLPTLPHHRPSSRSLIDAENHYSSTQRLGDLGE